MVQSLDLQAIVLPDGSLSMEAVDDKVILCSLKNIVLNLAALPSEFHHMLWTGVTTEFRAWEQCALSLISEYRVNNEICSPK